MGVGFQVIFADHGLKNRSHFLRLAELATKLFDDAEDGGGAGQRVMRFVFPSEIEAEMKNGGTLKPGGQRVPGAPRGPALTDEHGQPFEEIEKSGG